LKTGTIRSTAFSAPGHCLVLPVLHGIASYGQSVEVRDADSNQPIAKLPMLDGQAIWERWRIVIPEATRKVVVMADDEGMGPNQWVAVATPERCP
jgi:hypothetical protein